MHHKTIATCLTFTLGVGVSLTLSPELAYGEEVDDQRLIEEITVTARRRAESSQDVPIPVTAFSGEKLEKHFAATIEDFNHSIPNVQIEHVGLFQSAASVSFRGVGTAGIETFLDPVVAVFVDGAYFSRNAESALDLTDIESIEVLRGPQGTLYGRNAFAGAIAVRTKRPEFNEFGGKISADIGNGGRQDFHVALNIPLIDDKLALRLTALSQNLDGFYENAETGADLNGESAVVFRPSLKWQATEALDITLIGEIRRDRGDSSTGQLAFYWPGSDIVDGQLVGGAPSLFQSIFGLPGANPWGDDRIGDPGDGSDPFKIGQNLLPNRTDYDIDSLTIDANYVTSYGTWSFMGNVRTVEDEIYTDTDGTSLDLFSSARFQEFDSAQMELRFVSDYSDKYDLVTGIYYLQDSYEVEQILWIFFAPPFTLDNVTSFGRNEQERFSAAVYGQIDYHMNDALTLTAGLRWTYEKKEDVRGLPILAPAAIGVPFTGDDPTNFRDFDPSFMFGPVSESWDNLSPRLGIDYKINDDVMIYAFWQRAFKSGGFVNNAASILTFSSPIEPEQVDNFEIGIKSDFLDHRLQINLTIFFADYTDLQRSFIRAANTPSGQETFTDNVAAAEIKGIELELIAVPIPGLTLFANVGYLDAEHKEYCVDVDGASPTTDTGFKTACGPSEEVFDINGDFTGTYLTPTDNSSDEFPRAPKWDLDVGGEYEFDLAGIGLLILHLDYSYTSRMMTQGANDPYTDRGPLETFNANLTWMSPDQKYRIALWGRNLNDDVERLNSVPVATLFAFAHATQPKTYGLTVSAEF